MLRIYTFLLLSGCYTWGMLCAQSGIPADSVQAKLWIKQSNKILATDKQLSYNYADSAYYAYKALQNKNGMGDALVRKGLAISGLGNFDEALLFYAQAYSLFTELQNKSKQGKVLNNIGYAYMQKGEYDKAVQNYMQSMEIRQSEKDSSGIAACYTNIAIVFAIKNELAQAESYFSKAVDIYRRLKDEVMLNKNLLNLGGVYKDKGQYGKSIESIKAVYAYYEKQNIPGELARCHYILGANYENMQAYDSAFRHFTTALNIYTKLNDKKQIAGCKLKLAEIAGKRKDFVSAIEQGKEALAMAKGMKTMQIEMQTHLNLSDNYARMGDFKHAFESRLEYERIKDSIFSQESNQKIMELETLYQLSVKKQEIDALKADKRISDLELIKKNNFTCLLASILVLLLLVILLIYSLYRVNSKSNSELKIKNAIIESSLRDKEILLGEIHHRVKNNLQFIWSMFNLQARHVKDAEALRSLTEGKNRIKTMALLHQKLYQSDNLTGIDVADYIPGLVNSLFETYRISQDAVELQMDIEKVVLDIDTAIPLGLILNELITNSLKYAVKEGKHTLIQVQLKQGTDSEMLLSVKDNGPGLPAGFNYETAETFGLKLIKTLAAQIKASVRVQSAGGTETSIRWKHTEKMKPHAGIA